MVADERLWELQGISGESITVASRTNRRSRIIRSLGLSDPVLSLLDLNCESAYGSTIESILFIRKLVSTEGGFYAAVSIQARFRPQFLLSVAGCVGSVCRPGFFPGAVLPGKDDYSHRWCRSWRDG